MARDEERPLLEDEKEIVEFDANDEEDPMNWSFSYKVLTTILFSLTTLGCTFTSSVFSSAQDEVAKEFGISILTVTLGTSLYGQYFMCRARTREMDVDQVQFWHTLSVLWHSLQRPNSWVERGHLSLVMRSLH